MLRLPSRRVFAAVYLASGIVAGLVSFSLGQSRNLEVFRHAARALLAGRDLYDGSSVDWFKYSPTFALLFVPLAWMPAWIAAAIWGACNFGVAFLGVSAAAATDDGGEHDPNSDRRRRIALLAALPGVLLATDGDQANLLVAGAMLYAFSAFTRGRSLAGALAIALATLVKIFPLAAAVFVALHRDRERSLFRIGIALALGLALPLLVLRPHELGAELTSWITLVRADHANRGWSLVTIARDLGASSLTLPILAGLALLPPLIAIGIGRRGTTEPRFRRAFAASVLTLIVLCNHRSEYTSFVISALGVGLWFADGPPTSRWRIALLMAASIAHGPIPILLWRDDTLDTPFAFLVAHRDFHPLRLLPLVIVWALLQIDLFRVTFAHQASSSSPSSLTSSAAE